MNMSKFWLCCFSLCVGMAWLGSPAYAISIGLEVQSEPIVVNDTFEVFVWANQDIDLEPILNFGFDVNFDSSWSDFSAVVNTSFDDKSGDFPSIDVHGITKNIGVVSLDPSNSSVLLATLSFQATQAGLFRVEVVSEDDLPSFLPGNLDYFNEGLYTQKLNKNATRYSMDASTFVSVGDPVPEPTTLLLFVTGLAALANVSRKKR